MNRHEATLIMMQAFHGRPVDPAMLREAFAAFVEQLAPDWSGDPWAHACNIAGEIRQLGPPPS